MARKRRDVKVTWAEAVRDIVIRAIDRGQLPLLVVGVGILLIISRIPDAMVGELAKQLLQRFVDTSIVGWVLTFILAASWAYHAKWQRQVGEAEVKRVSDEKTELQKSTLGAKKVTSSRRPRTI